MGLVARKHRVHPGAQAAGGLLVAATLLAALSSFLCNALLVGVELMAHVELKPEIKEIKCRRVDKKCLKLFCPVAVARVGLDGSYVRQWPTCSHEPCPREKAA